MIFGGGRVMRIKRIDLQQNVIKSLTMKALQMFPLIIFIKSAY